MTTANSHNNDIEYFKDNRNSVNSFNKQYDDLKRNLDREIKESPTFRFDVRKHSVNPNAQVNTTLANSSKFIDIDSKYQQIFLVL